MPVNYYAIVGYVPFNESTGPGWELLIGGTHGPETSDFRMYASGWEDINGILPSTNQWYHFVGTYDGTTEKFYINGTLVGSRTAGLPVYSGLKGMLIGMDPSDGNGWIGCISDVCLYNRALSQAEITELYNTTTTLPDPTGTLNTTIYSMASVVIPNATVTNGTYTQTTNVNGIAAFSNLPVGSYDFTATAPGYFADTGLLVNISANTTTNVSWFLTQIPPPTVPALITPSNAAINVVTSPEVVWSTVTNALTYSLQVSLSSAFSTIIYSQTNLTGISTAIAGLPNNTLVYWQVNAANVTGTSIWSPVWSFTTLPAIPNTPVLSSPSNMTMNVPLTTQFSWNSVQGATSYIIRITDTLGLAMNELTTNLNITVNLLSHDSVFSGYSTTYWWQVAAINAGGTSNWSTLWSFTTIPVPPPTVPTLISPINGVNGQPTAITLIWHNVMNAVSYRVQASFISTFNSLEFDQSGIVDTSTVISGIPIDKQVFWRVNATNTSGTSIWSTPFSFTTPVREVLTKIPIGLGYSGTLAVYDLNGKQVQKIDFTASESKETVLRGVKFHGMYLYNFLLGNQVITTGKLVK
jgi:hypothetical protein